LAGRGLRASCESTVVDVNVQLAAGLVCTWGCEMLFIAGRCGRACPIAGVDDWRVNVPVEEAKARGVRTRLGRVWWECQALNAQVPFV